jgi:acyl-CoA reductase-like NAD-dependent aldehyde dehydrogenase
MNVSSATAPTGTGYLAGAARRGGGAAFRAVDPTTGTATGPEFASWLPEEVAQAAAAAREAWTAQRREPAGTQARLLREISVRLQAAHDGIVETAHTETGISPERLEGELLRTRRQLTGFAEVVEGPGFGEPLHEPADPTQSPPRPDLRRVLLPVGPVAVFGASNFPLAFSVAGGDTASAFAAGCPVVVQAHPSHPGTSELVGAQVTAAVAACGLHPGTFSLVQGAGHTTGAALVTAPQIRAVGFTGSLSGGRALSGLAAARDEPIPVYAEMGSLNPLFVTDAALRARQDALVDGFTGSLTTGAGQLCTKPGLVFTTQGRRFAEAAADRLASAAPGVLLNQATHDAFHGFVGEGLPAGVTTFAASAKQPGPGLRATPVLVLATLDDLRSEPSLLEEHFGPFAVVVDLDSEEDFTAAADLVPGSLTATLHCESDEHAALVPFVARLAELAGRVLLNGFPTGLAVSGAQTHSGPYPAASHSGHTSVGWTALRRFQRPVTFQDVPETLLPHGVRPLFHPSSSSQEQS